MPFKHVAPGEGLKIRAADWNGAMDAARAQAGARLNGGIPGQLPAWARDGVLPVRNDDTAAKDRFDVLGISGVVFVPATTDSAFENEPVLTGVVPATANHSGGKLCILLAPAAVGAIAPGLLVGVTACTVNIVDADHGWADITDGQAGYLTSCANGPARILYKPSGTGQLVCLVRVGESGAKDGLFAVDLTQTGGSAGDSSNYCSYTYTVKDLNGGTLGTGKAPLNSRARIVKAACAAGTHGTAYYSGTTLTLWDCDETATQTNCT